MFVIDMRFDVQNRGAIQHIQTFDPNARALDRQNFQPRQADGIGPDGGADAEHPQSLLAVRRTLGQGLPAEFRAFMEMENHQDMLAHSDIL